MNGFILSPSQINYFSFIAEKAKDLEGTFLVCSHRSALGLCLLFPAALECEHNVQLVSLSLQLIKRVTPGSC